MTYFAPQFDPSTAASGTVDPQLGTGGGAMIVFNLSPFDVTLIPPDDTQQFLCPANAIRTKHYLGGYAGSWGWKKPTNVVSIGNAYTSTVVIEVLKIGVDTIPPESIVSLTRQANVGQLVTSVTQVIQDGQATAQTIVEATPTASAQTILLTTDGKLVLASSITAGGDIIAPTLQVTGGPSGTRGKIDFESPFVVFRVPESGALALAYILQTYDGAAGQNAFGVGQAASGTAGTWISDAANKVGAIGGINGQATAGSFGVPMVVGRTGRLTISDNAVHTIYNTAIPANGHYMLCASLRYGNSTVQTGVKFQYTYLDANGGTNTDSFNLNTPNANPLDGSHGSTPGIGNYMLLPETTEMNAGAFSVTYQDPTGTANDIVAFTLLRLD